MEAWWLCRYIRSWINLLKLYPFVFWCSHFKVSHDYFCHTLNSKEHALPCNVRVLLSIIEKPLNLTTIFCVFICVCVGVCLTDSKCMGNSIWLNFSICIFDKLRDLYLCSCYHILAFCELTTLWPCAEFWTLMDTTAKI